MSPVTLEVAVLGAGLWAEGIGTWEEACARWRGAPANAGDPPTPSSRPQTSLLPPAERRRAPATVLLALAVAEQACRESGLDAREVRSVFTSAHGDLDLTDYLCATLAESPELLSPTKFHHSVHNAASGYWTIGVGNTQASTALSAGPHSFAQGLLEAATQVVSEQAPVLLVAYDMPAPGPLVAITDSTALVGVALVLAPVPGEGSPASLSMRLQDAPTAPEVDTLPPEIAALQARSPMAVGLPLVRALALGGPPHGAAFKACFSLSPALSMSVTLSQRNEGRRR